MKLKKRTLIGVCTEETVTTILVVYINDISVTHSLGHDAQTEGVSNVKCSGTLHLRGSNRGQTSTVFTPRLSSRWSGFQTSQCLKVRSIDLTGVD